jgi:hypothetical protein
MGNCNEHELYDDTFDENDVVFVRMRATQLQRQWCERARDFLEKNSMLFVGATPKQICSVIAQRYVVLPCDDPYEKYVKCNFLLHCPQMEGYHSGVWGFYAHPDGYIIAACRPQRFQTE